MEMKSANFNLGKEVSMGHTAAFWDWAESEQPSRFTRGIKTDKSKQSCGRICYPPKDKTDQWL